MILFSLVDGRIFFLAKCVSNLVAQLQFREELLVGLERQKMASTFASLSDYSPRFYQLLIRLHLSRYLLGLL